MTLTDDQLVERARAGDDSAMGEIFARYETAATWQCKQFYARAGDRDDLHQEARIGLYQAVRDYQPGRSTFKSFAFLCMRRQLITAVKAATRMKHEMLTWASRSAVNDEGDEIAAVEMIADDRGDPAAIVEARAELATVIHVVGTRLSPLERTSLLGTANGETMLEVQARLGRPTSGLTAGGNPRPKVVENAIDRAKLKLRRALAEGPDVPLGRAA